MWVWSSGLNLEVVAQRCCTGCECVRHHWRRDWAQQTAAFSAAAEGSCRFVRGFGSEKSETLRQAVSVESWGQKQSWCRLRSEWETRSVTTGGKKSPAWLLLWMLVKNSEVVTRIKSEELSKTTVVYLYVVRVCGSYVDSIRGRGAHCWVLTTRLCV